MADFFCPFPCAIPLDICHSPSISAILSAFLCQISFGTRFVLFIANDFDISISRYVEISEKKYEIN